VDPAAAAAAREDMRRKGVLYASKESYHHMCRSLPPCISEQNRTVQNLLSVSLRGKVIPRNSPAKDSHN
jgi:hypothetical protein